MKKTLLKIDWASLSYHQWWAIEAKKKTATQILIDSSDIELHTWRQCMLNEVLGYIKEFNPLDIYLSAEGNHLWRKDYVKQYYDTNTKIHYDKSGYHVVFDNVVIKMTKDANGEIVTEKSNLKKSGANLPEKSVLLESAPQHIKDYIWDNQVVPKYKGNRNADHWPFYTDKNVWRDYKEVFAKELAPLFRGNVIGLDEAEGDDAIYVTINYLSEKYDEIILVTGDSDMNQLLTNPKLRIYNHKKREFVTVDNPDRERDIKILSGDSSDNIKGIGIATSALRLGDSGAAKLLDKGVDIYNTAKLEGWLNQFQKNQMLVNLQFIPTDIQRKLCEVIDNSKPELKSADEIGIALNMNASKTIDAMKNLGFYTLLDRDYVLANPETYNGNKSETKSYTKPKGVDLTDVLNLDLNSEIDDLLADDPLEI